MGGLHETRADSRDCSRRFRRHRGVGGRRRPGPLSHGAQGPVIAAIQAAIAKSDWTQAQDLARDGVTKNPANADYHSLYAYSIRMGANPALELVFRHYNEALRKINRQALGAVAIHLVFPLPLLVVTRLDIGLQHTIRQVRSGIDMTLVVGARAPREGRDGQGEKRKHGKSKQLHLDAPLLAAQTLLSAKLPGR
ncbi:MAG TPA: hypothetical protein VGQ88_05800 [Burkholderiales bacterium]|nr:hypothetical protein [Burkholderiales bacterium]